jgi:5-methylcytosine-specific restriction endonuclease McrA
VDLCSDCHGSPSDGTLRRGLCHRCYEHRRVYGTLPVQLPNAIIARKEIGGKTVTYFKNAWDRFR